MENLLDSYHINCRYCTCKNRNFSQNIITSQIKITKRKKKKIEQRKKLPVVPVVDGFAVVVVEVVGLEVVVGGVVVVGELVGEVEDGEVVAGEVVGGVVVAGEVVDGEVVAGEAVVGEVVA